MIGCEPPASPSTPSSSEVKMPSHRAPPRHCRRRLIPPFVLSDRRFPVDVERAKRDHGFLDRDALDSLCR